MQALSLRLTGLLQPQRFLTDLLELRETLLARLLVLLGELALELDHLLIELLPALQGLLLELLAPLTELLLELGHPRLMLLLGTGDLLTRLADHLLTLLAGLLAQFGHLPFRLMADRLAVDQLLTLLAGLTEDLLGLAELLLLAHQLLGPGQLSRQGIAHGVHQFDGVLLVHQPAAAEGDARAFEHDLLQLIQLIQNGAELRLGHHA
ncbi:MAG: hypothetical protein RLZZ124_1332 [Cyanobacteriota bacterium]